MLHPTVGDQVDEEVVIQGHRMRFATINLMANARTLVEELLAAISPSTERDYGHVTEDRAECASATIEMA